MFLAHDDDDEKECGSGHDNKLEGIGAKLMKSRTVLVSGTVDPELAEKVMAQLLVLDGE